MDVKIENMDTAIDACGDSVYISCAEEIAQRVKIACTIKKGDFVFDRELGSFAHTVSADDAMLSDKLEMMFKEATIDIPYTNLRVLSVDNIGTALTAQIEITCGTNSATTEVELNG